MAKIQVKRGLWLTIDRERKEVIIHHGKIDEWSGAVVYFEEIKDLIKILQDLTKKLKLG